MVHTTLMPMEVNHHLFVCFPVHNNYVRIVQVMWRWISLLWRNCWEEVLKGRPMTGFDLTSDFHKFWTATLQAAKWEAALALLSNMEDRLREWQWKAAQIVSKPWLCKMLIEAIIENATRLEGSQLRFSSINSKVCLVSCFGRFRRLVHFRLGQNWPTRGGGQVGKLMQNLNSIVRNSTVLHRIQ